MIVNKSAWHYKWLAYVTCMQHYITDYTLITTFREEGKSWVDTYESMENFNSAFKAPSNFCQYWRAVLLIPFIVLGTNLLIAAAILSLFWWKPVAMLYIGGFAIALAIAGVALVLVIALLSTASTKVRSRAMEIREDPSSFVGNLYGAYKGKVCTVVEYKKEEDNE